MCFVGGSSCHRFLSDEPHPHPASRSQRVLERAGVSAGRPGVRASGARPRQRGSSERRSVDHTHTHSCFTHIDKYICRRNTKDRADPI